MVQECESIAGRAVDVLPSGSVNYAGLFVGLRVRIKTLTASRAARRASLYRGGLRVEGVDYKESTHALNFLLKSS